MELPLAPLVIAHIQSELELDLKLALSRTLLPVPIYANSLANELFFHGSLSHTDLGI